MGRRRFTPEFRLEAVGAVILQLEQRRVGP